MLSQAELKEHFHYNPETGLFIRLLSSRRDRIGKIAGGNENGYVAIKYKGKFYKAHRLAWLYIYGYLPQKRIDHINGDKSDNRINNLREVTHRENHNNTLKHRNGKLPGCYYCKTRNKWRAKVQINKKGYFLGTYKSEIEAHQAYLNKLKEIEEV